MGGALPQTQPLRPPSPSQPRWWQTDSAPWRLEAAPAAVLSSHRRRAGVLLVGHEG